MKRRNDILMIGLLSILCAIECAAASNEQSNIDLVKDGKSHASIVLGEKASSTEQYAAKELQLYLNKLSEVTVPIQVAGEKAGKIGIIIGTPSTNSMIAKSRLLEKLSLGRDGFLIKTIGNQIILAGENPSGALYATYAFLEEHLGIRWYFPGPKGEYVPTMTDISIGEIDDTQKPAFEFRGLNIVYFNNDLPEFLAWMARNRMNNSRQVIVDPHHGDKLKMYMKYGFINSSMTYFSHFLHFSDLFETHPEYYPLLDGKRAKGFPSGFNKGRTQQYNYCLSNPGVVKEVAKSIRELVTRFPELEVIGLNQLDSDKWCECQPCVSMGSPSDRLHIFINKLVDELGPVLDKRFISTQAYHSTAELPVKTKPNKKVVVYYTLINQCARHGWNENCPVQERQKQRLAGWLQYGNPVVAYTYPTQFSPGFPMPLAYNALVDMEFYNKIGVAGWYPESAMDNPGQQPLNRDKELLMGDEMYSKLLYYYVGAKALWNPKMTLKQIKDDFFPKFYGSAGPAMRKYYDALEVAWRNPGEVRYFHIRLLNYNPSMVIDFLNPPRIKQLRSFLLQAENAGAGESEVVRSRIERDAQLFSKWEKRYQETKGVATRR